VPAARAEEGRARLLELVPEGFEEIENGERLELAAYVDAGGEARLRRAFAEVASTHVLPDWTERWHEFHSAVHVGGVWIGPPWETPPQRQPAVMIEPGRAFGTGAQLCIELLSTVERGSLLDVGSGSGVLALAGARLGFGPLVAVDVDPVAIETTRANAVANAVELTAYELDALVVDVPPTDVTVANLLLAPVVALLPRLPSRTAVVSGYLSADEPSAPGWRRALRLELDGWAADVFERR
jgi:ribosomal protein L11 methyltransferase